MDFFENDIDYRKDGWQLQGQAEWDYRSHINGWQCDCPNSWLSCTATRGDEEATIWWYADGDPDSDDGGDWVKNWDLCADIQIRD